MAFEVKNMLTQADRETVVPGIGRVVASNLMDHYTFASEKGDAYLHTLRLRFPGLNVDIYCVSLVPDMDEGEMRIPLAEARDPALPKWDEVKDVMRKSRSSLMKVINPGAIKLLDRALEVEAA